MKNDERSRKIKEWKEHLSTDKQGLAHSMELFAGLVKLLREQPLYSIDFINQAEKEMKEGDLLQKLDLDNPCQN